MENINTIPTIRHLDDIDDLRGFGRDGELLPDQEIAAREYAKELVKSAHEEEKKGIFLLCSTARRGKQTGQLISEEIKKEDPSMKVGLSENVALTNMYEGEINLPDSYCAGDKFPGFTIGKKVFAKEVFGSTPNFLYRFGDPVDLGAGLYKYPELQGYFKEYGESYRDFMVRLLKLITDTASNLDRLNQNTKVVAITHSLQYQMFYDLQSIAEDVIRDNVHVDSGTIPLLCWSKYQERMLQGAPTYEVRNIEVSSLCSEKIVDLFNKEIDYLNNLN